MGSPSRMASYFYRSLETTAKHNHGFGTDNKDRAPEMLAGIYNDALLTGLTQQASSYTTGRHCWSRIVTAYHAREAPRADYVST